MFETPMARTVTAISSVICILTSIISIATFLTFPWFQSHPRQLYLYFTIADLLASLLALPVLIMGDNHSAAIYMLAVLAYAATLCTYIWQLCMSHAIYLQLQAMNMKLTSTPDSVDQLLSQRDFIKSWKKRYIVLGWLLPSVLALLTLIGVSFSSIPFTSMTSHSDIPKIWFFNLPDILIYVLCCGAAVANMRLGKKAMESLGVGTSEASIHENSVTFSKTYLGMAVLFGVLRFPSVLMSTIQLFMTTDSSIDASDDSFFAGFAAFNAQFTGIPLFFWFAYKFDFVGLWKRAWEERSGRSDGGEAYLLGGEKDGGKVTETLAGVF